MDGIITYPHYYIQSDWYESKTNDKIWLYSKNVNKESKRKTFTLKVGANSEFINENNNDDDDDDFTIVENSKTCLAIQDKESLVTHRFLPPTKVFTSIHQKSIECLDVAPNGMAVSGSVDGTLKVWDTYEGIMKTELKGHLSDVNRCRFFPSNEVILSAGHDMLIKIWSAIDGHCPVTLKGHSRPVSDVAIVDRGRNVVSVGHDGMVKLWSCAKQACIEDLYDFGKKVDGSINGCHIGSFNDVDLGKRLDPPNDDCVSTSDKLLLVAHQSGSVFGVGVHSKQCLFEFDCKSPVNCCAFTHGHLFVAGTEDGKIIECDLRKPGTCTRLWRLTDSSVKCLLPVSRPFNGFVAGHHDGSVIFLYDNQREIVHLTGSDCDPINEVRHDHHKFIYTACRDGKVRQYFLNNAFE